MNGERNQRKCTVSYNEGPVTNSQIQKTHHRKQFGTLCAVIKLNATVTSRLSAGPT